MIPRLIEYSVRNRFIVLLLTAAVAVWGVYCVLNTPIDAIPDLSENQVIVFTDWMGRSPQEIDDQITYPLSVNLQGLAGVKAVRSRSEFNFSMINIIFDDKSDFYFARTRVLERLNIAGTFLPPGVTPYLAPDATALGQIFWYTIEGEGRSLEELRSIQDWYVRYQLYVAGVAEVASAGGFVREYQIDVDPEKLRAYDLPLGAVYGAVARSNISVGGKVYFEGRAEFLIRGVGWLRGVRDIESVVVAERNGVPITVERLAKVQLGPEYRRSLLEKNGGEAVGGVVMMRYGENPLTVTRAIKQRIEQLQPGLPEGVRIVPFYDRTRLIGDAIGTLRSTLTEELIVASLAILLILRHVRSSLVVCLTLPLAVLIAFIFMYYLNIPSNIMSLSGIAISIGLFVDAAVVMVENTTHELTRVHGDQPVRGDITAVTIRACRLVGKPIFYAIGIMLVSFIPVFALGGMEGKMFLPLAYTKTFAMIGVGILAVTFVPAIIPLFVKGRLQREQDNRIVRAFINIYMPVLTWLMHVPAAGIWFMGFLFILAAGFIGGTTFFVSIAAISLFFGSVFFRRWWSTGVALALLLGVSMWAWHFPKLGREFMPPLDEGSILDMPVTVPRVSMAQAGDDIRVRDAVMRGFPEVDQVVGKVGRADTPTDPSGIDMVETIVTLRPKAWWPKRKMRYADAETESAALIKEFEDQHFLKTAEDKRKEIGEAIKTTASALERLLREAEPLPTTLIERSATLTEAKQLLEKGRSKQSSMPSADEAAIERSERVYRHLLILQSQATTQPTTGRIPFSDALKAALAMMTKVAPSVIENAANEELNDDLKQLVDRATMDAVGDFDRAMRDLARRRQSEFEPVLARRLVAAALDDLLEHLRRKGALLREPTAPQMTQLADTLTATHGILLVQVPRPEEMSKLMRAAAASLTEQGAVKASDTLFVPVDTAWTIARDAVTTALGGEKPTLSADLFARFERRLSEAWIERVGKLNWELEDHAFADMERLLVHQLLHHGRALDLLAREPTDAETDRIRKDRVLQFARNTFLWRKDKGEIVKEMDSELQMPGWGNIWTQPIINRVDMLATGVRTMIGVKVFGPRLADGADPSREPGIQTVANQIAAVMRGLPGAVDVFPDQIVGRSYLQIDIDREKAARYGVNVADISEAIEIAMGGKAITTTVEGRQRFPVRVRYARDFWQSEQALRRILVTGQRGGSAPRSEAGAMDGGMGRGNTAAGGGAMASGEIYQIPISDVADIRVVEGPSVIPSENGMLRAYVQLNVRDRDIVGFVEEAQQAVAEKVKLPPGFFIEWSGQFEHQVRARKTLTIIFPLVVLLIFVILYMTFNDVRDALLIMLAVPGALAGGVIFQSLFGFNFSVAVWVGYIACFGEATQTGIVMLVYLHEAIRERGGLEKIASLAELRETIVHGAVHRLRPKLMTEGTAIVGLMPMLWATGVGAEVMRPMAAPVLGGMLVADEVIDLLLPVIFNWYQARRWRRMHS